MLLVLPPPKTKRATLFLATQGRTWVVKRATLLFNLVCSNIGKQVALFCCPFYCSLSLVLYSFLGVQTSVFIQNYRGFGGMLSGKKKKKLDSRKRHILHSLNRTQLIYTPILLSFQISVSLFKIPVRFFFVLYFGYHMHAFAIL